MLTLFVVPTVYTLFDDLEQRIKRRSRPLDWSSGDVETEPNGKHEPVKEAVK
jgi:hypothetical protein